MDNDEKKISGAGDGAEALSKVTNKETLTTEQRKEGENWPAEKQHQRTEKTLVKEKEFLETE